MSFWIWGEYLWSQTLLLVEVMLIIQRWNWQSENAQIRIIKLFMSLFQSFFMQLQVSRPGRSTSYHRRLNIKERTEMNAPVYICSSSSRLKVPEETERWTSVCRSGVQSQWEVSHDDMSPQIHHCGGVMWCDGWALSLNWTRERGRKWPKMNIILWSNQHEKLFLCLHKKQM